MLATDVNDNAGRLIANVVWTTIASVLAPTGKQCIQRIHHTPFTNGSRTGA